MFNLATPSSSPPRLGVFKFASCDGCQLQLLSLEDELLALGNQFNIVHFLEASSHIEGGPYDIALVEGSITTYDDRLRIQEIRKQSRWLVTIGACATSGGIQALKNWADRDEYLRAVYAHPEYIETLSTSSGVADHVQVDFELRGCPINRHQLLEVLLALAADRKPRVPTHSVCLECKRQSTVCVAVSKQVPCLGPITQAGCGAICPAFGRGCYGCFGPAVQPNGQAMTDYYQSAGHSHRVLVPLLRNFNANAPAFREAGDHLDPETDPGNAT